MQQDLSEETAKCIKLYQKKHDGQYNLRLHQEEEIWKADLISLDDGLLFLKTSKEVGSGRTCKEALENLTKLITESLGKR